MFNPLNFNNTERTRPLNCKNQRYRSDLVAVSASTIAYKKYKDTLYAAGEQACARVRSACGY